MIGDIEESFRHIFIKRLIGRLKRFTIIADCSRKEDADLASLLVCTITNCSGYMGNIETCALAVKIKGERYDKVIFTIGFVMPIIERDSGEGLSRLSSANLS